MIRRSAALAALAGSAVLAIGPRTDAQCVLFNFGAAPASVNGIVAMSVAVLDFGTPTPAFPTSGISDANYGVDPSGNTPAISLPLWYIAPLWFPAGTFATTSGQYVSKPVSIASVFLGSNTHAWVQFPPGDPGLLGIGADSSASNDRSFYSLDGYSTPAVSFFLNWGIRVKTN